MSSTPTVHVYDDALETSEVLAAVYEPRGFEVRRLTSRGESTDGAEYGSAVVVLSSHADPTSHATAPLKVLIGRIPGEVAHSDARRVAACSLSSLFDYRELVSAIDLLLCGTD
jgi:hypothetical protein